MVSPSGIDVRGPRRDDPLWTHIGRYVYDPVPTLRASTTPLLAIFGELDTPEAVMYRQALATAAEARGWSAH